MHAKLDYDPNDPVPDLSPGSELGNNGIERYLNAEALSMPAPGYPNNKSAEVWRERAVIVIFNVATRENLDPFLPYLAMNYYDRYISRDNPLPGVMKYGQNDLELLCICCLTLACKMRDKYFSMIEFRERHSELKDVTPEKFLVMELHILRGIDWHLRAVTALCFVRFFAPEFQSTYGFRRRTINQIIIHSQNELKNTRFRPSVMAVSALLAASSFLYPERFQSFVDKVTSQEIFKEGDVLKCMKGLIRQCKELNILIESAVAEDEYLPRKRVRAGGEISEDDDEMPIKIDMARTSRTATAETAAREGAPQRPRWRAPRPSHKQVAAESSGQAAETSGRGTEAETFTVQAVPETPAAAESQVAGESSGRATAKETLREVAAEEPKPVATESSERADDEKLKEGEAEKSEQAATEEPEQLASGSSEQAADEKSKEVAAEKSEQSTAEELKQVDERSAEKVADENAKQKAEESTAEEEKPASSENPKESSRVAKGKSKKVTTESFEKPTAEESKKLVAEKTAESTDNEVKQVATEGPPTSAGTSTQRAGTTSKQSKGKEKVSEVEMMEIPKMAEDNEDLQMGFMLRWRLGETNADGFVIFTHVFDPARAGQGRGRWGGNPAAPTAGANQPLAQVNQLREFCSCCYCSCCNPFSWVRKTIDSSHRDQTI